MFDFSRAVIVLVGPLPPPAGGMANQMEQLARLLAHEGAEVRVVRTNEPYRPSWAGRLWGLRALFRFIPYLRRLLGASRGATLFHVFANSGWSWHLFAAPALWAARLAGVPSLVNYRGGEAERFFSRSFPIVFASLRLARSVAVPSAFLKEVFSKYGVGVEIVPNIVDLEKFRPSPLRDENGAGPLILVARNLEPIYDLGTAIRAFALVRRELPHAILLVAGSGPESSTLRRLTAELTLEESVRFLGNVENAAMPELYRSADLVLNTSLADNMPISILEALASGVPVVSTDVGGIPALVDEGREAILVPPRDPVAIAAALGSLWREPERRAALRKAGLEKAAAYDWRRIRDRWAQVYARVLES